MSGEMNGVQTLNEDQAMIFSEIAERFHNELLASWMAADRITSFRELSDGDKLEALLAGTLTSLIEIAFSGIKEDREDFIKYLTESCIPMAREIAMENEKLTRR